MGDIGSFFLGINDANITCLLDQKRKEKKRCNWKNLDVCFITEPGKDSVVSAYLGNLFMNVLVWSTVPCTISIISVIDKSLALLASL